MAGRPEGGELHLYLAGSNSEGGEGTQLEVIDALESEQVDRFQRNTWTLGQVLEGIFKLLLM
jgi:hypothetical protein